MSPTQSLQIIGFAKEVTFGTFVAPTYFVPGTATPQSAVTVSQPAQSRGTRAQVIDVPTQLATGVQISCEVIPEVVSRLVSYWFGVGSDALSGSSSVGYTHTLTPQNSLPSCSVEIDSDIYTQVLARQITGNMVDQMTLTLSAAQFATYQFTTVGQKEQTPATPGLPSNPTPALSTLIPMSFDLITATAAGATTTQLIDATLTAANQVQRIMSSNDQIYPTRLQATQRKVTFSTTLDFLDSVWYNYWATTRNQTGFIGAPGLSLALTSNTNIPGTSNPYVVQFNLPTLRPQDQYTLSSASDALQQQLSWSVTQGSAANEINAKIINSEATAYA